MKLLHDDAQCRPQYLQLSEQAYTQKPFSKIFVLAMPQKNHN